MSKKVNVLLLEDIESVGTVGQIVSVAEGYARNSLFPEGKAALANAKNVSRASVEKKQQREKDKILLADLQEKASSLDGTELVIAALVKEGEEIFGSINAARIVNELNTQTKNNFHVKTINLSEPITSLGTYPVNINLSPEVTITVHVTIVAEESHTKQNDD
jgi:large subunit ribosomal protein L9